MSYQPKLNLEMVRLGYVGADPKVTGVTAGYQLRQTPDTKKQAKEEPKAGRRPNPYMK